MRGSQSSRMLCCLPIAASSPVAHSFPFLLRLPSKLAQPCRACSFPDRDADCTASCEVGHSTHMVRRCNAMRCDVACLPLRFAAAIVCAQVFRDSVVPGRLCARSAFGADIASVCPRVRGHQPRHDLRLLPLDRQPAVERSSPARRLSSPPCRATQSSWRVWISWQEPFESCEEKHCDFLDGCAANPETQEHSPPRDSIQCFIGRRRIHSVTTEENQQADAIRKESRNVAVEHRAPARQEGRSYQPLASAW